MLEPQLAAAIRTATVAAAMGLLGTAGALIVVVAAVAASLIPAMRAMRLDPSSALRTD
jgi:ABC-type lipoprotein release transport system permease subunit